MQVVDELRRGVRLKKINFHNTPMEYGLTPYEILMEDIRSRWEHPLPSSFAVLLISSLAYRKYQLRKVMVNGDIPPRVKKDAHAVILEFIRSRPPLRKVRRRFSESINWHFVHRVTWYELPSLIDNVFFSSLSRCN